MNSGNFYSRVTYFLLGLRDKLGIPFNPREELNKLDIREGQIILDYGCGTLSQSLSSWVIAGECMPWTKSQWL